MKLPLLKPMVVVAAFSLVACNDDHDSPTDTDAGADAHRDDVVATPDVHVAEDVHAADNGKGAEDGSFRDENVKPDAHENDVLDADVFFADREPDVTADVPIDRDGSGDAPFDGSAPTRPDGGPFSCYTGTWERTLVFTATLPTGALDGCALGPTVHRTVSGVLRSVTSSAADNYAVTIDTCTGDGCAAQNVVLDIISRTPLTLPVGAFVEADYFIERSFLCSYFVRFSNLPEFNGQKNPISDKSKLYFIGSDGFFDSNAQMAPVGVGVSLLRLGCPQEDAGPEPGQHPADTYVYQFSHNGNDLVLAVGESATWTVNGQSVLVKNLRSYQSKASDDYWNWAYTFVGQ